MKLTTRHLKLPLARPFTISRGTLTEQDAVVVQLDHEGVTGWGEVTANTYYGHSLESIEASVESVREIVESGDFDSPESLWGLLKAALPNDSFAVCAIDLAAQDLFARLEGKACWERWGLEMTELCPSSYTIAIDSLDVMIEKLREQPEWPVYKIKLGTDRDLDIVKRLREETDAIFRVDANCAWTVDEAVQNSKLLAKLGVEFIEQPLPFEASAQDAKAVYENSALPIIADESCRVESDVKNCVGKFHGINVKLCKCGGLTPAVRMLKEARSLGLKTMVGCMIESSIGISANAQLLPLLDYADLDGAILLSHDPASGVGIENGRVSLLEAGIGTGASLK